MGDHYIIFPMNTAMMILNNNDRVCHSAPVDNRRHSGSRLDGDKWATGLGGVGNQASLGKSVTGRNLSLPIQGRRKTLVLGTWNVQGLMQPGKLHILERELCNANIKIGGIGETHWRNSGHFETQHSVIYSSGNPIRSHGGVAFIIPKALNRYVTGYNPINERLISININTRPVKTTILQVYAPTSESTDEEIEKFYSDMEGIISKVPSSHLLIVMGDFNAKVGKNISEGHLKKALGPFGLGIGNDRGERLIQFALDNDLVIGNTLFAHHPRRLYTWTSPNGQHRNQIDYILIRDRWRTSLWNARTRPGSVCGSDHQLLTGKVALKLHAPRKVTKQLNLRFNADEIERVIAANPLPTLSSETTVDEIWTTRKSWMHMVAKEIQTRPTEKVRKHWMTESTYQLVDERRRLKNSQDINKDERVRELNREIKRACRKDKNSYLGRVCNEIETHAYQQQPRDLYKKVKQLTREFKPRTWSIKDHNGEVVTEINDIAEVWRQYCQKLFEGENTYPSMDHLDEPDIMRSEIEAAIARLKNNKAVGTDEISAELIKQLGDYGVLLLHDICQVIWTTGEWPEEWRRSVFVPLHKKGATSMCDNYRLIALLSHASKVMLHIIQERLRPFLSPQISDEQTGFVRGKGTREHILNLRQLIEKVREYNVPMYICFIDYSKAFDSVKWSWLWRILDEMGVPKHLTYIVSQLYKNSSATVRIDQTMSDPLLVNSGVRQGCILSPLLFNIYGEYIIRQVLYEYEGGVSINGRKISNLRYADDTVLIASSTEELESVMHRLEVESERLGLYINRSKTKVMIIDRANNNRPDVQMVYNCDVVDKYIYLGSLINNNGNCEPEIRRRIEIARGTVVKLVKIWKDRDITKATKLRLLQSLVFPILLYASETWTIKSRGRKKLEAFEMWSYRRILRIPWTAKRTNLSVLEELGIKKRLYPTIQERILRYFGHIARRADDMELLVVEGKVEGRRPRGRSPTRWTDLIREMTGTGVQDAVHAANDRQAWRNIVRAVTTPLSRDMD